MFALYLLGIKRLVTRPLVVALSILGIATGVGLVVSVNAVLVSVDRSIDELVGIDDDATLSVTARSRLGMSENLVASVDRDPDVLSASPQLVRPVLIDGVEAMLIGRADIPVVMAGSTFEGRDNVELATSSGPRTLDVVQAPAEVATINSGSVVLAPLAVVQDLLGREGSIDSIALDVTPGTEQLVSVRLAGVVEPGAYITSSNAPQEFASAQMEQIQQPLIFMATVALIAGGFLVFNTVQNSARQQERELAVVRALGGSRRQIAGSLLVEATALGVLGSVLGVGLGQLLGRTIVGALPDLIDSVAGTDVRYHADLTALPTAMLTGVIVAVLSAAVPVWRVTKARPQQVLARRPGSLDRTDQSARRGSWRMGAVGLIVIAGGFALTRSDRIEIAQNGIGVLLLGLLIVGYSVSDSLARAAGTLAGSIGSLGSLVKADIGVSGRRVWGTIAAVFTAVLISMTVEGAARNQSTTVQDHFSLARAGDLFVMPTGADDLPADFHYPSAAIDDLMAVDGVTDVYAATTNYGVQDDKRFVIYATDGPVSIPAISLADDEAINAMLSGPAAIITHQFARSFDLEVGDTMMLDGIHGPIPLDIVAITRTTAVSTWGTLNMSRTTYIDAFGDPGLSALEIVTGPDADHDKITEDIRVILGDASPVIIASGEEFFRTLISTVDQSTNVFLVVTSAIVGVAGIATLNATASSVVERRRQLGLLRSVGATPQQIRRLVCIEVFAAGAVGTVAGLIFGNLLHRVAVDVTDRTSPFPEDYSFSWASLWHALVAATVAIALGALIPAWQNGRSSIAEAMAYE